MNLRERIIELFVFHKKLKFSEIEKLSLTRSNKIDYYLKQLIKEGVLGKNGKEYFLSESAESLIPYISMKQAVIPVVLIKIKKGNNVFLYERSKRPYQGKLSLPGGRLVVGEEISDAVKRILLEKHNVKAKFKSVDSISLEHLVKNKKIINTFLLILVSAEYNGDVSLVNVIKEKKKIISSDYLLITQKNSNIQIGKILSRVE